LFSHIRTLSAPATAISLLSKQFSFTNSIKAGIESIKMRIIFCLYNYGKIFNKYCKLQRIKNWSAYKYLLARRRHPPFTSNLLNILNKKVPIVSTRNYFNLQTGQLSSLKNMEDYDSFYIPGLNGNPCSDNNELAVYIHGV
jgi:hypothetical protein